MVIASVTGGYREIARIESPFVVHATTVVEVASVAVGGAEAGSADVEADAEADAEVADVEAASAVAVGAAVGDVAAAVKPVESAASVAE